MGSWGATDANESKPSFLTDAEKRTAYATTKGWVVPAGGNGNAAADPEVLVAIGGLSGATGINIADISSLNWAVDGFGKSDGGTISAVVNYNEEVTVTGTPTLTLSNSDTASYASGSGSTAIVFTTTVAEGDITSSDLAVSSISPTAGGATMKDAQDNSVSTAIRF